MAVQYVGEYMEGCGDTGDPVTVTVWKIEVRLP